MNLKNKDKKVLSLKNSNKNILDNIENYPIGIKNVLKDVVKKIIPESDKK